MSLTQLLDVPAPAKLNLFLHVVGQRTDGYHLLQSVFMLIDWGDTLHFERRPDGVISREDLSGTGPALPAQDLVVRAAQALQRATGCHWGAHIGLDKCLPQEAGLGGGSSDAASTLIALNRLWGLGLSRHALQAIGLSLGADVPFFLGGDHAWVEGVGEQLSPLTLPPASFWLIKPPSGASTPAIFRHPGLRRDTPKVALGDFLANPYGFGHNGLQAVAELLCPEIAQGLEIFKKHGFCARMTGSGSTVFAHTTHSDVGFTVPQGWLQKKCQNLFEHPLKQWQK